MPGDKTHGFDLVLEIAENPIRAALGDAIDASGILQSIFDGDTDVGIDIGFAEFTFDISYDRPSVPLPAGSENTIDLAIRASVRLSEHIELFNLGMRWVAGVDLMRSPSTTPVEDDGPAEWLTPRIDFLERLYFSSIDVSAIGIPLSGAQEVAIKERMDAFLREDLKMIPIAFPLEVWPETSNARKPKDLRVKVIDSADGSPNALALCVTYGGGEAGDLAAFEGSFLDTIPGADPTEPAWLMVYFEWICRLITDGLKQTETFREAEFDGCRLARPLELEDGVELTEFELRLEDGAFGVSGRVKKSGFCYEASAKIGGKIGVSVDPEADTLTVFSEIDDPDIDLDIPWYCVLLGALTFGALFGVAGVAIALLFWVIVEAIEGVFDWIADSIVEALNGLTGQGITIPTGSLELRPVDAFIDDLTLLCEAHVRGLAKVRAEGVALVRPGQGLELDTGKVTTGSSSDVDVRFTGDALEVGCGSELARTGSRDFDAQLRFMLYDQEYVRPARVELAELETHHVVGAVPVRTPSLSVFAIHTDDERYAIVQVLHVAREYLRIRYRTYEGQVRTVRIEGEFACLRGLDPKLADPVYVPPDRVKTKPSCGCQEGPRILDPSKFAPSGAGPATHVPVQSKRATVFAAAATNPPRHDEPCFRSAPRKDHASRRHFRRLLQAAALTGEREIGFYADQAGTPHALPADAIAQLLAPGMAATSTGLGKWMAEARWRREKRATFRAHHAGFRGDVKVLWWLDGTLLAADEGEVTVPGNTVAYVRRGAELELTVRRETETRFELEVAVEDENAERVRAARCVSYAPECVGEVRVLPEPQL